MNNPYLYTQLFWTMSVSVFIWICKGGEMKFHVPLKLMGIVYRTLLGCAANLLVSFSLSRKGAIWFQKFFVTFSIFSFRGRETFCLEMQGDALSIAMNNGISSRFDFLQGLL